MLGCFLTSDEVVKMLIDAKADVNAVDDEGNTALMIACVNNRSLFVRRLIKAKADVNMKDDEGNTALSIAKQFHYKTIENLLIEAGAKES